MSQSRRKLVKQIEGLEKYLQYQHASVHTQSALLEKKVAHGYWWLAVLIPAMWVGWSMSQQKWVSKWTVHVSELLTFVAMNYFRRQLFKLIP